MNQQGKVWHSQHWKPGVFMMPTLSSLVASIVVMTTTYGATSEWQGWYLDNLQFSVNFSAVFIFHLDIKVWVLTIAGMNMIDEKFLLCWFIYWQQMSSCAHAECFRWEPGQWSSNKHVAGFQNRIVDVISSRTIHQGCKRRRDRAFNTLSLDENIFNDIFLNEKFRILIKISLNK